MHNTRHFQTTQRAFVKYLIFLFAILLVLVPEVSAKGNKLIDGIKIRYGKIQNRFTFTLPTDEIDQPVIVEVDEKYSHLNDPVMFPIGIVLPETLMGPWSFRGAVFEYRPSLEFKDLPPSEAENRPEYYTRGADRVARQKAVLRTFIYNNFFNASDKSFADANSNWALSTDVTSSSIFLGYYWGVFYPGSNDWKNHRFMKIGLGFGVFYTELSYKLNLCSQYRLTFSESDDGLENVECVDKTEIDSAEFKGGGVAGIIHLTLWEKFTEDSIWKIGTSDFAQNITFI